MNSKYDLSEKYVFAIQGTKVIMDNLYFTFEIYVGSLFQVNFINVPFALKRANRPYLRYLFCVK